MSQIVITCLISFISVCAGIITFFVKGVYNKVEKIDAKFDDMDKRSEDFQKHISVDQEKQNNRINLIAQKMENVDEGFKRIEKFISRRRHESDPAI